VHDVKEPLRMTLMVGTLVLCETNEMVPFKCNECDFHASKKTKIKRHFKATHEVLKYYDCSQCLFAATSPRELDGHVKLSHTKNRKVSLTPEN
jgi:hypothetical protein